MYVQQEKVREIDKDQKNHKKGVNCNYNNICNTLHIYTKKE